MRFTSDASLFYSQITQRRFDDETLRILETLLVCKDVKTGIEEREKLSDFLRSQSSSVIPEIAHRTVEHKLFVLEFFVRAFALIGDIESCLALKYEALLMRESKSRARNYKWLQVSHVDWLNFAEQCFDYGFYSVVRQACEIALSCLEGNDVKDHEMGEFVEKAQVAEKLKRLRDRAAKHSASGCVQAQAAEYLKRKADERSKTETFDKETNFTASQLFREGIKVRNMRKLLEIRRQM